MKRFRVFRAPLHPFSCEFHIFRDAFAFFVRRSVHVILGCSRSAPPAAPPPAST
ncbi:hypothetical protein ABLN64_05075 [Mycobacterium tuberculosis]